MKVRKKKNKATIGEIRKGKKKKIRREGKDVSMPESREKIIKLREREREIERERERMREKKSKFIKWQYEM